MRSGEKFYSEEYQMHETYIDDITMKQETRITPTNIKTLYRITFTSFPVEHHLTCEKL